MAYHSLRPNAVLLADRWCTRARHREWLARFVRLHPRAILVLFLPGVSGAALLALLHANGAWLGASMATHPLTLSGLCAAVACYAVLRTRRRRRRELSHSFLVALPLEPVQIDRADARAAMPAVLGLALAAVVLIGVAATATGAQVPVAWLVPCALIGIAFGSVLGWRFAATTISQIGTSPTGLRWRTAFAHRRGMDALAYWPLLYLRSRTDPRTQARVLLPVLLAMPVGIPITTAFSIVALFVLLLALRELASTLLQILPRAFAWLESLPLTPTTLLTRVCWRIGAYCAAVLLGCAGLLVLAGLSRAALIVLGTCVTALFAASALAQPHRRVRE